MNAPTVEPTVSPTVWDSQRRSRLRRLERATGISSAKRVNGGEITALLQTVMEPGDRVCLEGNNQKQADFLASLPATLQAALSGTDSVGPPREPGHEISC